MPSVIFSISRTDVRLRQRPVDAHPALGRPSRRGPVVVPESDGIDAYVLDRPSLAVRAAVGHVLEAQQDLLAGKLRQTHALVDPRRVLAAAAFAGVPGPYAACTGSSVVVWSPASGVHVAPPSVETET